jgi:dCTP deaminase
MILTGPQIELERRNGRLHISPWTPAHVSPNSYDFRLGDTLLAYRNYVLDCRKKNPTETLTIPEEGLVLHAGRIYLGHTIEVMGSEHYVPIIRGRSSVARLGLFIHVTADLIDIGSINQWTLQLHAVQPVRVYRGMRIGQVTFWRPEGRVVLYDGKYQGARGPRASEIHREFVTRKKAR